MGCGAMGVKKCRRIFYLVSISEKRCGSCQKSVLSKCVNIWNGIAEVKNQYVNTDDFSNCQIQTGGLRKCGGGGRYVYYMECIYLGVGMAPQLRTGLWLSKNGVIN